MENKTTALENFRKLCASNAPSKERIAAWENYVAIAHEAPRARNTCSTRSNGRKFFGRGNREKVSSERSPFRSDDRGNREQVNTDRNDSRGNREQKSGERKYENRNPRFAGGGRKFSSDTRGAVRGERKPFSDRTQRPQPQGDDRRHRKTQSGSSSGPSRNKFTTRIRSSAPRRDSTR